MDTTSFNSSSKNSVVIVVDSDGWILIVQVIYQRLVVVDSDRSYWLI